MSERPTSTVEVTCCYECPFVISVGQCIAADYRWIRQPTDQSPPPEWCPLRVADRLVTLRVS